MLRRDECVGGIRFAHSKERNKGREGREEGFFQAPPASRLTKSSGINITSKRSKANVGQKLFYGFSSISTKKCYHRIRRVFTQLFCGWHFFRPDSHRREITIYWDFGPFWSLWHLEKFRGQAENRRTQFPSARGSLGEKNWTPQKFLLEIPQHSSVQHFFNRAPTGGRSRLTRALGHFSSVLTHFWPIFGR